MSIFPQTCSFSFAKPNEGKFVESLRLIYEQFGFIVITDYRRVPTFCIVVL